MRSAFIFFLAAAVAGPLFAQTTDDAREQLSHTLAALEASKEREKQIAEKNAKLEREMKSLQQEMASLGKDTKDEEAQLLSYEEKLAILEEQKKDKTDALAGRQAELSAMVSAMVKLSEMPPEAVIAMPGKLDETLATARSLGLVAHAVEQEADDLKAQLRELDALEDKIRQNREAIAARRTALAAKQKDLEDKVRQRSTLQQQLGGKEREERERAARLTSKSRSLQDLLDSLQKSEQVTNAWERTPPGAVKKRDNARAGKHRMRSFADAEGNIVFPAAGRVVSRYGSTGAGTAFAKGIVIEAREGGDVVAPYDGEVVFAGNFRDYGRMVIIRHSDDYHTLLSGLDQISCTPGQFLLAGEPIGTMGRRGGGTRLYVELREEGKPVDPLPWFRQ